MVSFLLGLTGALVGGMCLSLTTLTLYYFERRRVQKETNDIVNKFKEMHLNQSISNNRNPFSYDSKLN